MPIMYNASVRFKVRVVGDIARLMDRLDEQGLIYGIHYLKGEPRVGHKRTVIVNISCADDLVDAQLEVVKQIQKNFQ